MRPLWLVVLASLWIATVCNVALWRELARLPGLTGGQVAVISIALVLVIALATTALLSLLAWRWTLMPAITVFLLSAAFGAYFMMAYGVVIDKTMMINTLQTDVRETRDLLNWRLLATVLVLAVLPLVLLWRQKVRRASAARQLLGNFATLAGACVLLVLVVFLFFQSIASVMRNYTHVRYLINPLNSLRAGCHRGQTLPARRVRGAAAGRRRQTGRQLHGAKQATAAAAGAGRDGAQRQLLAQRLRPAHQPAAGQRKRREPAQCLVLRHQHGGLGALHVLQLRTRGLRRAARQLRGPARRCCSAPAWPCSG